MDTSSWEAVPLFSSVNGLAGAPGCDGCGGAWRCFTVPLYAVPPTLMYLPIGAAPHLLLLLPCRFCFFCPWSWLVAPLAFPGLATGVLHATVSKPSSTERGALSLIVQPNHRWSDERRRHPQKLNGTHRTFQYVATLRVATTCIREPEFKKTEDQKELGRT